MFRISHRISQTVDRLHRGWPRLYRSMRFLWSVAVRAVVKYDETDGEQRAASFAYYAFFSLFPLLLLLISVGAMLLGDDPGAQDRATTMTVNIVKDFIPVAEGQANWFVDTVIGVVKSRNKAGVIAFVALAWSAIRFFQALVHGVNKAWGTKEYSWWRLPIQNMFMVGVVASALLLGVVIPYFIDLFELFFWQNSYRTGIDFAAVKDQVTMILSSARRIVPSVVLFYGFAMLYKFAPRRRTTFKEIWVSAALVTLALQGLQSLFVIYSTNIGEFNRLYGTLGSVIALLMWIYLSGSVIILGGCISAALYEVRMSLSDQSERSTAR